MLPLSLDRFSSNNIPDPQDRPVRYRGPYDDPHDDGDWMELSEEDKKRRARFNDEEDEDE